MLGSISIGRVFGITIRVHWLFLAMVAFFVFVGAEGPYERLIVLLGTLVLSTVVLLHELGHSLVAKAFGLRVVDITFWPLGGMARMSEIPESTRIEGLIAVAGPMVNFVLAALALPFASLEHVLVLDFNYLHGLEPPVQLATLFVTVNLMLGLFNLIPAFPMDGGRVLRALLGLRGDWVVATETAVRIGRFFAVAMIVWGLFGPGNVLILPLIGVFVWFAGSRELLAVRLRHGQSPLARAFGFAPDMEQETFAANAPRPRPRATEPDPSDPSGARRPEGWEGIQQGRLSDDDIERLERYRGRL